MNTGENVGAEVDAPTHPAASEQSAHNSRRLNWLRAGVLGANDGIVAVSGLVIGVAASGAGQSALLTAGLAGLAAGALSMAVGEYVSVSTQRDTESALISKEQYELSNFPVAELEELAGFYQAKGLTPELAHTVAEQLTAHDALAAHAEVELKIDHEELTNPWHAAVASLGAFISGSLLPLLTILLVTGPARIPLTVVAAGLALALTGWISARLGYAKPHVAIMRNVIGGLLAMIVTYAIGTLVGTHIG
ncbi:MAG: VIT family protein [Propionibacteriaceae bacterium]|nr:VIT family protein [Propionibacteriaceae bacterium]